MSYYFNKNDLMKVIIQVLIFGVLELALGSPLFWNGYNKAKK